MRDVYRRVPSLLVLADFINLVPLPTLQVNALTLHPLQLSSSPSTRNLPAEEWTMGLQILFKWVEIFKFDQVNVIC